MTLYEFNKLSDVKKLDQLSIKGIELSECVIKKHKVILYTLNNFYCEIWCDRKNNKLAWIKSSQSIAEISADFENIKFNLQL
jgi:hypothetical protein